jgi:hypothetical protein
MIDARRHPARLAGHLLTLLFRRRYAYPARGESRHA